MDTKASADEGIDGIPYVFEVNGDSLMLSQSISAMKVESSDAETKAKVITGAGDDFSQFGLYILDAEGNKYNDGKTYDGDMVTVSYASGQWTMGTVVWWPSNGTDRLQFYAGNSESHGSAQTVAESFPTDGGMKIEYSDAGSDSDSAAESEADLLYAYSFIAQRQGVEREDDTAISLTFHHALAGMKFNFGTITENVTLTNVTLRGIATSGECLYENDEFTWTPGTESNALSQSFDVKAADGVTECDAEGTRTFFIIPQTISDDATISFTLEYVLPRVADKPSSDYAGTGKTITKTVDVKFKDVVGSQTAWESGMLYNYTISGTLVFAELGYTIPDICNKILSPAVETSTVKSVNFSVDETPATKATLVTGPEVQSSRSLTKIYATFDSESGELTLHTTAPKIYAQPNSSHLFSKAAPVTASYGELTNLNSIINLAKFDTRNAINMNSMFYNCSSLTSLDLKTFDTSNVTNMGYMFMGCSGLTALDVSKFNTSNVTSMGYMFYGCSGLSSLSVTNFDTSKVTAMNDMFHSCSSLSSLDVSKFNTSSALSMSGMFQDCKSLTKLDVTNFNTSNVTSMGYMFYGCSGMKSLDVTKFNTSNVKSMASMFAQCTQLASLDVTNFDTSSVTNMSNMFYNCNVLEALDVTKFNTSNVTKMNYMFRMCYTLTSLDVRGFNTSKVTDMSYMFHGCSGLTALDVTKFDTSSVTNMSNMFRACSTLTSLDVTKFNTSAVTNMNRMFAECELLASLDLSNFSTSEVTDMSYMFDNCFVLTEITINNETFDTSNVIYMQYMFCGCNALTSIDLSKFNTSNVTNMSIMFQGCKALTSLVLSSFETSNVTAMNNMFYDCNGLTTLTLSTKFDTSNVTNMKAMFYDCTNLPSLDLSSFSTSKVTDMTQMFDGCVMMKSLTLGTNFKLAATTTSMFMIFASSAATATDKATIKCTSELATAISDGVSTNKINTSIVKFVEI